MSIKCFWLRRTERMKLHLRRYVSGNDCKGEGGYHQAMVPVGEAPEIITEQGGYIDDVEVESYANDERWPVRCAGCGYEFSDADNRQVFTESIYCRADDPSVEMTLAQAPVGAMWNSWWLADIKDYAGSDGISVTVRLPTGHDWIIDSRASNCDSQCKHCGHPWHQHKNRVWQEKYCEQGFEDRQQHKCWIRHGTAPDFTVDKNGVTCKAGAGSILVPGWHGFLRDGVLVPC